MPSAAPQRTMPATEAAPKKIDHPHQRKKALPIGPFFTAVRLGNASEVRTMIEVQGYDVDTVGENGVR